MSSHIEAASVTPPDIVLQGSSGGECEAFVVAIQEYAFATGQDDDPHWMMRCARTRLRGKALRWYAHLDPPVKKDWELFVQAMFDQYPLDDQPVEGDVRTPVWSSTTFSPGGPAATLPGHSESSHRAQNTDSSVSLEHPGFSRHPDYHTTCGLIPPTRRYNPSSTEQQIGLLRIVYEQETSIPEYVWWGYNPADGVWIDNLGYSYSYRQRTTPNRQEALIVKFLPSSGLHTIACLNSKTGCKGLAIQYPTTVTDDNNIPIAPQTTSRGAGFTSEVWRVLENGTLEASLSIFSQSAPYQPYEEIKFTTTEVHIDISGDMIYFVKPGAFLRPPGGNRVGDHASVRARIVFEPL
ncbi:hypothetical protein FRB90_012833 [Tulasnella sp. 427]|nr:hypothetical protein FRB90_012833 [Tulasnella sp. 427]